MALNLVDIASVAAPAAVLGAGGAGIGSIIDMLAGTKHRWTKILGLLGLAGGAGLGSAGLVKPLFAATKQELEFPEKLSDIPRYAGIYRYIVSMRLGPDTLKNADDPILQLFIKTVGSMDAKTLYNYFAWPGRTPSQTPDQALNQLPKYRSNPYHYNMLANIIPANDPRQFAILHATYLNLEMVPLQLCWNELDKNQRNQLFSHLERYREALASTADSSEISQDAENALETIKRLLIQSGKQANADALQILHNEHRTDAQELARQIQQVKQQP